VTVGGPLERLSALMGSETVVRTQNLTHGRTVAVGWATVELERAAVEVGAALRASSDTFVEGARTLALGARCRIAGDVPSAGISLVLLEPDTEGRLAATLARLDEGPAAIWLEVENLADAVAAVHASGSITSPAQAGPFGAERLLLDGPHHGPYRLLVERPGTIRA
jgi:hypothetical protein